MENNSYSGPVLLLSQEIWAKTWQQSLSPFTKQSKTAAGIFCRLQVAGCWLKFNYTCNWKTAGTKNN